MRVADKMLFEQVSQTLSKNRADLSKFQNQAATLKRVTKPSDDPLAATRVLSYRTEEQANQQFLKTGAQARSMLEFADQSLDELSSLLIRVKELTLSQSSDASANRGSRRVVAQEVEQLLQQAVQVSNRKLGERFLFGGYNTTEAPFSFQGQYRGDDGEMLMQINKEAFVTANMPGSQIFLGKQRLDHEVGHTRVVQPRDEADISTVQEHQKKIEEQRAQGSQKDQPLGLRGPASVSQEDQKNEGRKEGGFGLSAGEVQGINIFKMLKGIEISLRTNDKLALQDAIDEVDEAMSQVVLARAEIGSRLMSLEANSQSLQKLSVDNRGAASILEDADQFDVVSNINKTEGTLQATLQTAGKLIQPSLLDFLR